MKMLGEITNDPEIGFCGTMSVITTLEFLEHFFSKLGHGDLLFLCPNLSQLSHHSLSADARTRASVRRAAASSKSPLPYNRSRCQGVRHNGNCMRESTRPKPSIISISSLAGCERT